MSRFPITPAAALLLGTSALTAAMLPTTAFAQATFSNINGVVTTTSGAPVSGASVTILYTPTNRVERATTSANGTFFATGLSVGGPYTVTVSSADGEVVRENVRLSPSSNSLQLVLGGFDEVIATATISSDAVLESDSE